VTDDASEYEAVLAGYRWRWRIVNALLAVAVVTGLVLAWMKLLRVPSPTAICNHLWELSTDTDDAHEARAVLRRVGGGLADLPNGETRLADTCRAFIDATYAPLGWRVRGELGRCLLASTTSSELTACWRDLPSDAADEVVERVVAANVDFPVRRPHMPATIEPHYDELRAIAERALDGCPALLDPDVGCYTSTWDGAVESRRDLAHSIPADPSRLGPELLALDAKCTYDLRTMVERHPQLETSARAFPLPVQRLGCDYLAHGKPHTLGACSSREPFDGAAHVGVDDNAASVGVPHEPACEGQWSTITIERTRGDGVFVEVTALFRGPAWDPTISAPFEIPEELRVDEDPV
jgi:hypothetical protein